MDFETLFAARKWMSIAGCPGRYKLSDGATGESPEAVVPGAAAHEFSVAGARDIVVVIPIADGGLISYRRHNGTFVHTLNTKEGFERKLTQLGIQLR